MWKEGIYQLIYGDETDISSQDIIIFYQNEVELQNKKIILPTGNANIETISINLKNKISFQVAAFPHFIAFRRKEENSSKAPQRDDPE